MFTVKHLERANNQTEGKHLNPSDDRLLPWTPFVKRRPSEDGRGERRGAAVTNSAPCVFTDRKPDELSNASLPGSLAIDGTHHRS